MSYKKSSMILRDMRYNIPYERYKIEKIEVECSICLELMTKDSRRVIKLYCCDHIYHEKCIKEWIEKSRNCPLCRKSVDEDKDKCVIL